MIFATYFVIFLCPAHLLRSVAIYTPKLNASLIPEKILTNEPWSGGTSSSLMGRITGLTAVRIMKSSKTVCVRRLIFNAQYLLLFSWGIGSEMFPRSVDNLNTHTRSTIPDCRAYQQVYDFAFLLESFQAPVVPLSGGFWSH